MHAFGMYLPAMLTEEKLRKAGGWQIVQGGRGRHRSRNIRMSSLRSGLERNEHVR